MRSATTTITMWTDMANCARMQWYLKTKKAAAILSLIIISMKDIQEKKAVVTQCHMFTDMAATAITMATILIWNIYAMQAGMIRALRQKYGDAEAVVQDLKELRDTRRPAIMDALPKDLLDAIFLRAPLNIMTLDAEKIKTHWKVMSHPAVLWKIRSSVLTLSTILRL